VAVADLMVAVAVAVAVFIKLRVLRLPLVRSIPFKLAAAVQLLTVTLVGHSARAVGHRQLLDVSLARAQNPSLAYSPPQVVAVVVELKTAEAQIQILGQLYEVAAAVAALRTLRLVPQRAVQGHFPVVHLQMLVAMPLVVVQVRSQPVHRQHLHSPELAQRESPLISIALSTDQVAVVVPITMQPLYLVVPMPAQVEHPLSLQQGQQLIVAVAAVAVE
jgi:hypothetical protein